MCSDFPPVKRLILNTIQDYEGLPLLISDMVEIVGCNERTIRRHIADLQCQGAIRRTGKGKRASYRYHVSEARNGDTS